MSSKWWSALAIGALAVADVLRRSAHLLPSDAYLALVGGRFIAQHGLPAVDRLATLTRGRAWIDEQWLGQLAIYGLDHTFGLRALIVCEALVTGAAFAVTTAYAVRRGSAIAAALVMAIPAIFFCDIFYGVRPQMFSLLFFAATLALAGQASRRVWWSLPLLFLWANVHGAVLLGAGLVGLRAAFSLVHALREKDFREAALHALLGALAALSPFASPYAAQLPRYFAQIAQLQNPSRHMPILEWTPLDWSSGWIFFLVAGAAALLIAWRRGPSAFETLVLALCAIGAWRANRNVQFFGLALAAYAPACLPPFARLSPRGAQVVAALGVALVLVFSLRLAGPVESDLPTAALPALHDALVLHPESSAVIDDRFADWALWHEPLLEGRIVFDVRFELLDDQAARDVSAFLFARAPHLFPDAHVALVSKRLHPRLSDTLAAHILWEDDLARLALR